MDSSLDWISAMKNDPLMKYVFFLMFLHSFAHAMPVTGVLCRLELRTASLTSVHLFPDDRLNFATEPLRLSFAEYVFAGGSFKGFLREGRVAMLNPPDVNAKVLDSFDGEINGIRVLWSVCNDGGRYVVGVLVAPVRSGKAGQNELSGVYISFEATDRESLSKAAREIGEGLFVSFKSDTILNLKEIGSVMKDIEKAIAANAQ